MDQYLAECDQAFREKRTNPAANPPEPKTAAELNAVLDRWPKKAHVFLPGDPIWLEHLGLSKNSGREIEPFPVEWFEQFLAAVEAYPKLARALNVLLRRAEAGEVPRG